MRGLTDRFEDKYNKLGSDECWEWAASKFKTGYGQFKCTINNKHEQYAHRVSAYLYNNFDLTSGLVILHSCDNPSCVNPKHLKAGTQAQNVQDTRNKKRVNVVNKKFFNEDRELAEFMKEEGATLTQIAKYFDCSVGHASLLARGLVRIKTDYKSEYKHYMQC